MCPLHSQAPLEALSRGPRTPVCSSFATARICFIMRSHLTCLVYQPSDSRLDTGPPDCVHGSRSTGSIPQLLRLSCYATPVLVHAYWGTLESCRRRSPARMLAYSYALDSGGKVPLAAQRSIRGCMGSSSAGLSISRAVAVRTKCEKQLLSCFSRLRW